MTSEELWNAAVAAGGVVNRSKVLLYPTSGFDIYEKLSKLQDEYGATATYLGSKWDGSYSGYCHGHVTTN